MAFVGSCQDMCPEKERQARFGLYMSIFEKDHNNQPDEYAMVKEYRRSGADQEEPSPQDLRTVSALELTMNHLVSKIMDDPRSKQQDTAIEWYDFLWDRLRALRKDITQQNICDQRTVLLVERCARFHVHSCYAMNRVKDFDVDMNKRNLNDCLQMLRQMYSDLRTSSGTICCSEMEFQKYDILLHLNDEQLSSTVLMKTSDHRSSEEMKFLFRVFSAYTNNDYYRFFQLMEKADYMTSCILSLYANKMRLLGFKTIVHACSSARQITYYPADMAIRCLGFDELEDLKSYAASIGVVTQLRDGKEYLCLSKDLLATIRRLENNIEPIKSQKLVEKKMFDWPVGKLVYGGDVILPVERRQSFDSIAPMDTETNDCIGIDLTNGTQFQEVNFTSPIQSNAWTPYTSSIAENHRPSVVFKQPEFGVAEAYSSATDETQALTVKPQFKFGDPNFSFSLPKPEKRRSVELQSNEMTFQTFQSSKTKEESQLSPSNSGRLKDDISPIKRVYVPTSVPHQPADHLVKVKQQAALTPTKSDEDFVDNLTHLERQVVALEDPQNTCEVQDDENSEPEINELLIKAIQKRSRMTREELADKMPAGRFQTASLASKRPTLKVCDAHPVQQVSTPQKRRKYSLDPLPQLESMTTRIKEEEKVNKIFKDLARLLGEQ